MKLGSQRAGSRIRSEIEARGNLAVGDKPSGPTEEESFSRLAGAASLVLVRLTYTAVEGAGMTAPGRATPDVARKLRDSESVTMRYVVGLNGSWPHFLPPVVKHRDFFAAGIKRARRDASAKVG